MKNCASLLVDLFFFAALLNGNMLILNTEKPSSEIRMMENSGISLLILCLLGFFISLHYEKSNFGSSLFLMVAQSTLC